MKNYLFDFIHFLLILMIITIFMNYHLIYFIIISLIQNLVCVGFEFQIMEILNNLENLMIAMKKEKKKMTITY